MSNEGWYRIGAVKVYMEVPKGKDRVIAKVGGGFAFLGEFLKSQGLKLKEPKPEPELIKEEPY